MPLLTYLPCIDFFRAQQRRPQKTTIECMHRFASFIKTKDTQLFPRIVFPDQ
jgi:hypothetical protein